MEMKGSRMINLLSLSLMVAGALVSSCNNSGFGSSGGGGSGNAPASPTTKKPTTSTTTSSTSTTASCTESRLQSIKSTKAFVDQKSTDSSIDIELTFIPCPSQKNNLTLGVQFDLDADLDFGISSSQGVNFETAATGMPSTTGRMNFVLGADLFGNSGNEYGHFESTTPMQLSPSVAVVTLRLKLPPMKVIGPQHTSTPPTSNFSVPLHVKIGRSEPITANISFSPQ